MADIENMSRSELWKWIKQLREDGADIDAEWGSKDDMLEALQKYYDNVDNAETEEISVCDVCGDPLDEYGGCMACERVVKEPEEEEEEEELEEEIEEEEDEEEYEEIASLDDLIGEEEELPINEEGGGYEVEVEKPKVAPKPKPKPKKKSYVTITHSTDIKKVKIGTLVKFRCKFYRGAPEHYATGGLIVEKLGGPVAYKGKLTTIIRKWILTKRIKILRWN